MNVHDCNVFEKVVADGGLINGEDGGAYVNVERA